MKEKYVGRRSRERVSEGQKIAELMRNHIIAENGLISQHSVRLVNYSSDGGGGGLAREKEKD
jgi:hypothetical protein